VADLDGDGRLDVVQSQGEEAFPEKVQLATAAGVAVDTAAPVIASVEHVAAGSVVHARVHDHQSPSRAHDWKRVWLTADATEIDLRWYGEYLWSATVPAGTSSYTVCAQDRAGNQACSNSIKTANGSGSGSGSGSDSGSGCNSGSGGGLLIAGLLALSARTRRTRPRSDTAPRRLPSA
jgi:hypothetical protein